jgi:hypothetical protein
MPFYEIAHLPANLRFFKFVFLFIFFKLLSGEPTAYGATVVFIHKIFVIPEQIAGLVTFVIVVCRMRAILATHQFDSL